MGGPQAMVLLRKDVRVELGKEPGDRVEAAVELDDKPREVIVAPDIRKSLLYVGHWEQFESLAYTHRKEYVQWIESAKLSETRSKRIGKMIKMLDDHKKSPH